MNNTQAVTSLSAIAQEGRISIFRLLIQATAEVSAGDIAQQLAMPNSTLSFHLKTLQQAGLILARQEGRHVYYRPNREAFTQLLGFLTENCCGGAGCSVTPAITHQKPVANPN